MTSATLHIRALDPAAGIFPLELSESGTVTARGELSVTQLQSGDWTVVLNEMTDAPDVIQRDVVALVSGLSGPARSNYSKWPQLGATLADWLLPPDIRQRLLQIPNATLSLAIEPEALARVPWELGRFGPPEKRLGTRFGLTRLQGKPAPLPTHSPWPIRILIVVGCSELEEADDKLGVRGEVAKIDQALLPYGRSVDVETIRRPTLEALRDKIKESHPHVLHFAGHAGPNALGEMGLCFDLPGNGQSWVWSITDMQSDLGELDWVPRFIFLNACRTSQEQLGAWSMQRSFVDIGTQGVLTMQADVRGDLAGLFAERLYKKLIERKTLQEALIEARQALIAKQGGATEIDWALPSLTTSDPTMQLFKPEQRPNDAAFDACQEFEDAKFYANCRDGRRALTRWLCPARQAAAALPSNVLILTGERRSGKSHLLKWSMETWAVARAQVRYLQLYDGRSKDFLGVLRLIRDGRPGLSDKTRYLGQGLPPEAFNKFNWELNNLLASGHVGEWDPAKYDGRPIPDKMAVVVGKGEERPTQAICVSFHEALKVVASNDPLILVIDQMSGPSGDRLVSNDDFGQLIEHLFLPIAKDVQSRIKLVFVATEDERTYYDLARLANLSMTYTLPTNVADQDLIRHAVEMFWHESEDEVAQLATGLLGVKRLPPLYNGLGRLIVLANLRDAAFAQGIKRML